MSLSVSCVYKRVPARSLEEASNIFAFCEVPASVMAPFCSACAQRVCVACEHSFAGAERVSCVDIDLLRRGSVLCEGAGGCVLSNSHTILALKKEGKQGMG